MRYWVVAGGAGFIGSNFIRLALGTQPDLKILLLDNFTYAGNPLNLEDFSGRDRLDMDANSPVDISDASAIERFLSRKVVPGQQVDAVINFAAETHVDRSIDDPDIFVKTNVLGAFLLADWFRRNKSTQGHHFRYLHVSTDEVYGSLEADTSSLEDDRYRPNSPYAASKAGADLLMRSLFQTYGFPVIVSNCGNNYGPFQFPEKLMPLMILNALEGKPLPIYGDGQNMRDWIFVEDHSRALLQILEKGRPGESYNIGAEEVRSNEELVHKICAILDETAPAEAVASLKNAGKIKFADLIVFVQDRPGHDRRYALDVTKIKQDLGWTVEETLATGLAKTVAWYLENPSWILNVQESSAYFRERLGHSAKE